MKKHKTTKRRNTKRKTQPLTRIEMRDVRNLILTSLFVIGMLFAVRVITDVPIKTIQVNSHLVNVNKTEIKDIVAAFYSQGFFTVKLNEFEQQLENIEWVYQANIKRKWPNTLVISMAEQQPTFRWAEQSLLNKNHDPFFVIENDEFSSLPKLKGSIGREKYLADLYNKYNKYFLHYGLSMVSIEEDARYEKLIQLDNGIQINVGKEQVESKIERFLLSLREFSADELAAISNIDLRHSNGFAVRWNT